ncbi:class I SAM-dependent methyltransferase [Geodermatophilus sabuli]|uniref:Methyltransferase domain-containing protein n=1 Tax=Geodermatophilus sabuli TaxID=1564158 RepID=A0A285ELE6_9ACTN|nr:class I SAM-dependent methyltransferase [Geodermatophilus sabuli]MBB3086825.1 cyclopropane fatty-acyl-phospholipid synthase-like methyltransferase [Geodermatophilus sabuli]SNX98801.1 Methyltransferase domain-containing protein [Geodermatophilus sabuli]
MAVTEHRSGQRTTAVTSYRGHGIHAAPGVHEYAVELVRAALPEGGRILEVGSGCGALALRLRDAGFDVVPTDLDPPHDWIHRLDLDDPQWTDDTRGPFDMVVCVETLEHVENPRQVLRAIRSLLRAGDRLLVSTPNITHPHSRLKMFFKGAPYIFGPGFYHSPGHITILPEWMLTEHIRLAGFDQIEVRNGGNTFYKGLVHLGYRLEIALLKLIGVRQRAHSGDGICTFVTATAS